MIDATKMGATTVRGAAIVEDHVFPSTAAYKAYLQELRRQGVDFYVLSFGPGATARIALGMKTIPMIDTAARCNVDPVPDNYAGQAAV